MFPGENSKSTFDLVLRSDPPRTFTIDKRFLEFSDHLRIHKDDIEDSGRIDMGPVEIDQESLELIVKLLGEHNYVEDNIKVKKPISGPSFKENVDPTTYQVTEEFFKSDQAMRRLLVTCDYLVINILKEIIYCKWATDSFYMDTLNVQTEIFGFGKPSVKKSALRETHREFFAQCSTKILEKYLVIRERNQVRPAMPPA